MKKKVSLARSLSQRVRKPARVPHPVQNKSAKPEVLSTAGPSEEERWQRDKDLVEKHAKELGMQVLVQVAWVLHLVTQFFVH